MKNKYYNVIAILAKQNDITVQQAYAMAKDEEEALALALKTDGFTSLFSQGYSVKFQSVLDVPVEICLSNGYGDVLVGRERSDGCAEWIWLNLVGLTEEHQVDIQNLVGKISPRSGLLKFR